MNKEEIRKITKEYAEMYLTKGIDSTKIFKYVDELEKEVEQLENIIKEAREYINEHIKYECDNAFNGMQFFSYHLYDFDKQTLLNTLNKGGESNV